MEIINSSDNAGIKIWITALGYFFLMKQWFTKLQLFSTSQRTNFYMWTLVGACTGKRIGNKLCLESLHYELGSIYANIP